jgi:predicted N-formylglutamate amidohydrolase
VRTGSSCLDPGELTSVVEHSFVLSCEHAGNEIPPAYAPFFDSDEARAALASHRGWDPGSDELGRGLARGLGLSLDAPLVAQRISRLLVECNRSLGHRALWSEFSRGLGDAEKAALLERHWRAHRAAVRARVDQAPAGALVVHVGVHTFTPVWQGRARGTDIGILYDSRRPAERELAGRWKRGLVRTPATAALRVHLNRPYRGWTDGLTTTLRGELAPDRYLGLELEVSQGLVPLEPAAVAALAETLSAAVGEVPPPVG